MPPRRSHRPHRRLVLLAPLVLASTLAPADAAGPPRPPEPRDIKAASPNGHLTAVLSPASGQLRVLDGGGRVTRTFSVSGRFSRMLLSNAGMIVLFAAHHELHIPSHDTLTVLSPEGKLLKRLPELRMGTIYVGFHPEGDLAMVAAEYHASPHLHLITSSGDTGLKRGTQGYRPGAVLVSKRGGQIACPTFRVGDHDDPRVSEIHLYDTRRAEYRRVTCRGAYVGTDQMAFSPDEKELVVVGPGFVKCYDVHLARRKWRRSVAHVSTGTLPVEAGVAVAVLAEGIATGHRVPTGPGYKYLITVFDRAGRPRHLFTGIIGGRRLRTNAFLTPEQPRPLPVPRIWTVGADGHSIQLNIPPNTALDLRAKPPAARP